MKEENNNCEYIRIEQQTVKIETVRIEYQAENVSMQYYHFISEVLINKNLYLLLLYPLNTPSKAKKQALL